MSRGESGDSAFVSAFRNLEAMVSAGDTASAASFLIELSKEFDLRKHYRDWAARTIARWVESADSELRRAVVFALCHSRPVPRYTHIAIAGWRAMTDWSRPGWEPGTLCDAHWYATALVTAHKCADIVTYDVIDAVVSPLLRRPPYKVFEGHGYSMTDADDAWRACQQQALRVLRALRRTLENAHGPIPGMRTDRPVRGWRLVAEVYYLAGRSRSRKQ